MGFSTVCGLGAFGALAATSAAIIQHLNGDFNALAVYTVGTLQGTLVAFLLLRVILRSTATAPQASPVKEEEAPVADVDAACNSTPRTLLRSVSAVQSQALVPLQMHEEMAAAPPPPPPEQSSRPSRSSRKSAGAVVEYSVDDYEAMREKKKPPKATPSSRKSKSPAKEAQELPPKSPDSGVRRRRQSMRTPKEVTRFVEE